MTEEKSPCKVRIYLNTKQPRLSRVIDVTTGEDLPVSDVQFQVGHATRFQLKVQLTMEAPYIEVVTEAPDDPFYLSSFVRP